MHAMTLINCRRVHGGKRNLCLILFGIHPCPGYRLVVGANRDEFYGRPTREAEFWEEEPDILAGRDLRAGGTWMGISRSGRFAAVTNFRETPADPLPPLSRGELTRDFLAGGGNIAAYLEAVDARAQQYRGFNLLLGNGQDYFYFSNHQRQIHHLAPGCYGLSNQLLDCDWPKVRAGRQKLIEVLSSEFDASMLFDLLFDAGDDQPFSASFITSAQYGTCASTVLLVRDDGQVYFEERNFTAGGKAGERRIHEFRTANGVQAPSPAGRDLLPATDLQHSS